MTTPSVHTDALQFTSEVPGAAIHSEILQQLRIQCQHLIYSDGTNAWDACDPDSEATFDTTAPIPEGFMTPEAITYIKHRDLRWDPTIDARKNIARHDRAHTILKTADTDKFMTLIDMTAQHPTVQEHVRDYRKEHPNLQTTRH